jgi:hypothetical protein
MAVYLYSDQQLEKMVRNARQFRVGYCVTSSLILAATCLAAYERPDLPALHQPVRGLLVAVLVTVLVAPLVRIVWNWRTWAENLENSLRKAKVDISCSTVSVSGPFGDQRQVSQEDVLRAEEPSLGAGLYLRTSNRYRWIMIPRKLDGYESIKNELSETGIVIVKTSIPPNWEELLGVLLFIGTTVCAVSVHNVRVLTLNFLISLLIAFGGYYVISSNPDNLTRMRWTRFAAFLPVAFAAWGLWFAVRG